MEEKKPKTKKEEPEAKSVDLLQNYSSCFQCGLDKEAGAKLKVIHNEVLCHRCRREDY